MADIVPQTDPNDTLPVVPPSGQHIESPMSAKEFNVLAAQAKTEQAVEELKSKYAGVYGWFQQQKAGFDTVLAAAQAEVADYKRQVKEANDKLTPLQQQADQATTVQTQLDTKTSETTALQARLDKQALLMKFPSLLAMKVGEGEAASNPVLDLALSANTPLDQLEKQLTALSATFSSQQPPTGYPSMPKPSENQDDTPEGYKKQAREWHTKAIHAATAAERQEASLKEAELWELAKRAVKK